MDHNLLVSELQALAVETKRRNPDVKDACETALELLRGGPVKREVLHNNAETLLDPIGRGCKTRVAKVIGISIAALQRLVSLGGVPTIKLPEVLQTLSSVANQAVDIQLKILQTLLSILTHNVDMHDDILGNALLLCFKLQDSRVSVVSSTAAATLRQAVMLIFDRVSSMAIQADVESTSKQRSLTLPSEPPTELQLTASALDTYYIFSDLCLLTAAAGSGGSGFSLWGGGEKEKPKLLKLNNLHRTFGLELIESILSGYEEGVKKRSELSFLLQRSLDPLLLKLLAEKPTFPVALRVCRLMFLLIRSFTDQLPDQVQNYLSTLIGLGIGDADEDASRKEGVSPWLRVLALETIRGVCGDQALLQKIYSRYDEKDGAPDLYKRIVSALSRLVNEKPALLGIGSQLHGLGVPHHDVTSSGSNPHSSYLDLGLGMVSSAASAGVSTVSAIMGASGGGLGHQSMVKLRLIEQHDKAEAPVVPDTYIYLLALQSLDAIAIGIHASAVNQPETSEQVLGMATSTWPALLAALSYCIGTNLSDSIFAEVLVAMQDFTVACGLLQLDTPRDAFLSTLGKYAVPPPVVSAIQSYVENPNPPRTPSVISADALGFSSLGSGSASPPSLSERNLACLKSTVQIARILTSTLNKAWHDVLEILQNANLVLSVRKPALGRRPTVPGASPSVPFTPGTPRSSGELNDDKPDMLQDLNSESIQLLINSLFDSSREMADKAFTTFITALCQLSAEMIGVDGSDYSWESGSRTPSTPSAPGMALAPSQDGQRRRTSGINLSHGIKSGDRSFSLTKLRIVATLNVNRIVISDPAVGWSVITNHLLAVSRHSSAASTTRVQASDTLGEILLAAMRSANKESRNQHQVFDVLVQQVAIQPISHVIATDYEVRSAGYHTLNQILEWSGHSLDVGWETIFGMLNKVSQDQQIQSDTTRTKTDDPQASPVVDMRRPSTMAIKGNANLVRIAFPSLTLICSDFLASLDPDSMRGCITCLGHFGRQREDVNITLAAIGLMWNVSDAVQADSKELWLYLLTELLELGRDSRLEVRSSAMQTLFRCVEIYGSGLSPVLWEDVLWKVIFPLLDATAGDDSTILALTSVGAILGTFLQSISQLARYEQVCQTFLDRLKKAFLSEPRKCGTAALKAMEKVLQAVTAVGATTNDAKRLLVDLSWTTFVGMGTGLTEDENAYTQDNLVVFVRIAQLLHDQLDASETDRLSKLSAIMRSVMTYTPSPDHRPDVDTMSPLQTAISELICSSTRLSPATVLSDLAEFASLAYVAAGSQATGTKLTFVALSKCCMPRLAEVFSRHKGEIELYENGTIESVLSAYTIPTKLKYDCPPANRFGDDPPLWKTAMKLAVPVLGDTVETLESSSLPSERVETIWAQIVELFSGILAADSSEEVSSDDEEFIISSLNQIKSSLLPRLGSDKVPKRILIHFADLLRKTSVLYHHDVRNNGHGGTTAPSIPELQERLRYWALETLVAASVKVDGADSRAERLAQSSVGALIRRCEEGLVRFLDDKKIRGHLPFGRAREEEILFILQYLATMRVWEGTGTDKQDTTTLSSIQTTSSRWHLFRFYPLLLEMSFISSPTPSMWIFPSEHAHIFGLPAVPSIEGLSESENSSSSVRDTDVDAGDGEDLIEVNAKDLARRCLELIGEELGVSQRVAA
ncbi:hypothetical protein IAU60_005662 [Kwoniella sp. DSM 27419]